MEFRLESEMAEPARAWLKSKGFQVSSEYRMPWGYCDLLGVSFKDRNVQTRLRHNQRFPIGSFLRADILLSIPDLESARGTSLGFLQKQYQSIADPETVECELRALVARKFVQVTPQGSYKKINGWLPLHRRIVALELKVSRIGDALHQAARNQTVADESYIGLPDATAKQLCKSKRAEDFLRQGVGIVGITTNRCRIYVRAAGKQTPQSDTLKLICADRFFQSYVRGKTA